MICHSKYFKTKIDINIHPSVSYLCGKVLVFKFELAVPKFKYIKNIFKGCNYEKI